MGGQTKTWRVVGGADRGGILVRTDRELSSPQAPKRLATGALVLQQELVGERLRYELIEGAGPSAGWVSVRLADKALLTCDEGSGQAREAESQVRGGSAGELEDGGQECEVAWCGEREVRVCSWNLLAPCYHRGAGGRKEVQQGKVWKARVELQLRTLLAAAGADVVCVQELWFSPTVLALLRAVCEEGGYELTLARRTGQKMDGVAVLVRSTKLEVLGSEELEICSMGNRVLLWLMLRTRAGGERFVVGTTHFSFPHGDQQEEDRLRQAKEVRDSCTAFVLKHSLVTTIPAVLAGDFNCEDGPASDEAVGELVAAGWRSAFSEACGHEAAATHRTHRGNHTCADLVLLRGAAVHSVSAELLPRGEGDGADIPRPEIGGAEGLAVPRVLAEWAQLSDHRPVLATLELRA